jgi:protein HIRA/HIR1
LLISSAASPNQSTLPQTQLQASVNRGLGGDVAPQTILDLSKPFDGLPATGLSSLLFGNKRKLAETGADDDNIISTRVAQAVRTGATSILANTTEGLTLPGVVDPSITFSNIRLAIPVTRALISRSLEGPPKADGGESVKTTAKQDSPVLEVRNPKPSRASDREPARVVVTKKGQILWQDFLPKAVILVTGNTRYWAAACEDGSLYVWSPAGRRIFNAFALEAQTVILECRGPWLLSITAVGICHIWSIEQSSSPHPPVSLAPLLDMAAVSQGPHLTGGPSIIFARLNSEGRIIVAMSDGSAYAYSSSMFVWQRLSEAWWAVGSQYWNTSSQATSSRVDPEEDDLVRTENISAGIIPLLERTTTSQTLLRGRAYFLQRLVKSLLSTEGYEGFEAGVSVAHLENRLAAALTLGAKEEYKVYLSMYAKRLGAENNRLKIEELLRSLLKGAQSKDETAERADELCGWNKELLLKEVVLILGESRSFPGLYYKANITIRKIPRAAAHHGAVCETARHHSWD